MSEYQFHRDITDPRLQEHLAHLKLRGLRPATIEQRRYAITRLTRALGKRPLRATAEELEAWQHGRMLSAQSRLSEVDHIQQFFRWAKQRKLIRVDPSLGLVRPKRPHRVPRPIAEDLLRIALDYAPPFLRPQLVLAAWCGLRAGEIARLQRDHILDGADPPMLLVADGKGGRQRLVPLGARVLEELYAYGLPSRGPVFPRRDGRPGHNRADSISGTANRYLHGIGIRDTLHSLRHRYGTVMYRESTDLRLCQELLGHNDPATTALYCAYSPVAALAAVRAIDDRLPGRSRMLDAALPLRDPASSSLCRPEAQAVVEPARAPDEAAEPVAVPSPAWLSDSSTEPDASTSEPATLERVSASAAAWKAARTPPVLSDRELEVLRLAADGLTDRQIAPLLGISALTVKSHFARMSERLGVGKRTQMVVFAMAEGLLTAAEPQPSGA